MKLLFIASDAAEFAGLLPHCRQLRRLELGTDWARGGILRDDEVVLAANGIGARRAAAALDAARKGFDAAAVASVGFCGALDPELAIADIVVGTTVFAASRGLAAEPPTSAPAHRLGPVCSVDRVARTAVEKARLRALGSIAVEMEAAGVATRAEALRLPFFCIKAVTDLAGEDMANDFDAALRPDGHFDTIKILASSLGRPWARLPELFRLRARCARAARALGDFIADCRF